jgi:hypothetical protein
MTTIYSIHEKGSARSITLTSSPDGAISLTRIMAMRQVPAVIETHFTTMEDLRIEMSKRYLSVLLVEGPK